MICGRVVCVCVYVNEREGESERDRQAVASGWLEEENTRSQGAKQQSKFSHHRRIRLLSLSLARTTQEHKTGRNGYVCDATCARTTLTLSSISLPPHQNAPLVEGQNRPLLLVW